MAKAVFTLTILLGAFLIFMVQPLTSKAALPTLGGAPFVWNGCMVFFQAALLMGYFYAHMLSVRVPLNRQPAVHLMVLALAAMAFPLAFRSFGVDPAVYPLTWLMIMLGLSVGLPFFAISATSPLVQAWFAHATKGKGNPYALYAASNVGSFTALLAYPVVIEPLLTLSAQAHLFEFGYFLLLLCFAGLAHLMCKLCKEAPKKKVIRVAKVDWRDGALWAGIAFVPASLLYGITTYITTDIASAPLFWVVPLALYLLSFVVAFADKPRGIELARHLHVPGAGLMAVMTLLPSAFGMAMLSVHLLVFFCAAVACHARLASLRPHISQLTVFYLWLSFGGVLGGLFNTFIAPVLFTRIVEYPLMLILSIVAATMVWELPAKQFLVRLATWAVGALVLFGFGAFIAQAILSEDNAIMAYRLIMLGMVVTAVLAATGAYLKYQHRPLYFASAVMAVTLAAGILAEPLQQIKVAYAARNVFGVSRVIWAGDREAWQLWHGTTIHGIQAAEGDRRLHPVAYYGALKNVFAGLPPALSKAPVGVIGMGLGTVACYGKPKQEFLFYEIDPLVNQIAHDTRFFTYLRDCPPEINIIMGDGRIGIKEAQDEFFGLIIGDAFSSDAIPVHLMTREAVSLYFDKLRPGGMLAFNISSRNINLLPVLSAVARDLGVHGVWQHFEPPPGEALAFAAEWVVLSKDQQTLLKLPGSWQILPEPKKRHLWRDDYSNLIGSLK